MQGSPCPCCGYLTFDEQGHFDICPVCFWEDDPVQSNDEEYVGRANGISLRQARANFKVLGACEAKFIGNVRAPLPDEIPPKQ